MYLQLRNPTEKFIMYVTYEEIEERAKAMGREAFLEETTRITNLQTELIAELKALHTEAYLVLDIEALSETNEEKIQEMFFSEETIAKLEELGNWSIEYSCAESLHRSFTNELKQVFVSKTREPDAWLFEDNIARVKNLKQTMIRESAQLVKLVNRQLSLRSINYEFGKPFEVNVMGKESTAFRLQDVVFAFFYLSKKGENLNELIYKCGSSALVKELGSILDLAKANIMDEWKDTYKC